MKISVIGFVIGLALLLLGRQLRAPFSIALFASIPFGATALVSIGGSSPPLTSYLLLLLTAAVFLRRSALAGLGTIIREHWSSWILILLVIYVMISAHLLPRLFYGETTIFVDSLGEIKETLLRPASGNYTQSLYFLLSATAFFTFGILLIQPNGFRIIEIGFFSLIIVHISLGLIDLAGKLSGAGDVLSPIRTASYRILADANIAGFWRIVGGHSEASAYGGSSVWILAFLYTYWRAMDSRVSFLLLLVVLCLLLLSTSSTAYVGLAVICIPVGIFSLHSAVIGRISKKDLILAFLSLLVLTSVLVIHLAQSRLTEPFIDLFQTMVLDKAESQSGRERNYWNLKSLMAFQDSYGMGIGIGSSRASSWAIAVISQLGILGTFMMTMLIFTLLRGTLGIKPEAINRRDLACAQSLRACALAQLVTASLIGGSADPGLIFFVALAAVLACRRTDRLRGKAPQGAALDCLNRALKAG